MKLDGLMLKKLFVNIQTDTYRSVFNQLEKERMLHPQYRDDELLMLMLCRVKEGLLMDGGKL